MIGQVNAVQIWIATAPIDMRKGFDRLSEIVRLQLELDPACGAMFVFRNKTGERLKILWWDATGLTIYYKRLSRGVFQFPASSDTKCVINSGELLRLLEGLQPLAAKRA